MAYLGFSKLRVLEIGPAIPSFTDGLKLSQSGSDPGGALGFGLIGGLLIEAGLS